MAGVVKGADTYQCTGELGEPYQHRPCLARLVSQAVGAATESSGTKIREKRYG